MKQFLAFPLALLAAACAPAGPVELSPAEQGQLSAALAGRAADAPLNCVNLRTIRGNQSVGEGVVLFEQTGGGVVYVNRTVGCGNLGIGSALVTSTPSGQLCRGDIARVVHTTSGVHEGSCTLGEFVPYRRVR